MCFIIDPHVQGSRRKVVYKTLVLDPDLGILRSPYYPAGSYSAYVNTEDSAAWVKWYADTTVKANLRPGDFELYRKKCLSRSSRGIYVYNTRRSALKFIIPNTNEVVVRLEVDPQHWLAESRGGTQAVYSQVFIPETQPFIEWY